MASLLDNVDARYASPSREHQQRVAKVCQIAQYRAIALDSVETALCTNKQLVMI
jgi:hypothetical protein